MKILNIKDVIELLNELPLPSDVNVRRKVFSLISELESEQKIQDKLRDSYLTKELYELESSKIEVIKKYRNDFGDLKIYDITISSSDVNAINSEISVYTNNKIYTDWLSYQKYIETEYVLKSDRLNINETTEEMFDGLSEDKISLLLSIIK